MPTLLCDLQHVPNLSVHRLHNREKSSVSSQAIVMVNMLLIVMNSYGAVGAI